LSYEWYKAAEQLKRVFLVATTTESKQEEQELAADTKEGSKALVPDF
jgi:hypothetical protein